MNLKKEICALSWSTSTRVFKFSKLNSFVPIGMGKSYKAETQNFSHSQKSNEKSSFNLQEQR